METSISMDSGGKSKPFFYRDDRLIIYHSLKPLRASGSKFKVGYSFGLEDNSRYIDFFEDKLCLEDIPNHLIIKFKDLNRNLKDMRFHQTCSIVSCRNYWRESQKINKNMGEPFLEGGPRADHEYYIFNLPVEGGCRIYELVNFYSEDCSYLYFGFHTQEHIDQGIPVPLQYMKLPLVVISSTDTDKILEKIKTIVLFS